MLEILRKVSGNILGSEAILGELTEDYQKVLVLPG